MFLEKLTCINFKNHEAQTLELSSGINCFTGKNGVGKTNLLDAIYYLSFCKSYFNTNDHQNILHGASFFAIHGHYINNDNLPILAQCTTEVGKTKRFKLNKKAYKRMAEHIGKIPLVMISPYDRDLINEGSEVRRKFIDGLISQFDPVYLDTLIRYNKALQQRNALLKQFAAQGFFNQALLDQWSEQLIRYGEPLFERRIEMVEEILPLFQKLYAKISNSNEEVTITYASKLKDHSFKQLLEESQPKDRILKYSSVGVHKDDIQLFINGYPLKKYGSQGQQKSYVTALKLAQFEHYYSRKSIKPILLLDDIFDKLDQERVGQLVDLVGKNGFGQVFITDTQADRMQQLFADSAINHRIFTVLETEIKQLSPLQ